MQTYTALTRTLSDITDVVFTSADLAKIAQFGAGGEYYSAITEVVSSSSVILAADGVLPAENVEVVGLELVGDDYVAPVASSSGIITLAQAKALLQITDTSRDTIITALIPGVQEEICDYCNNDFTTTIALVSENTSFTTSTIDNAVDEFTDFVAGEYRVSGSKYNDGVVTVTTAAAHSLTVSDTLTAEALGNSVNIARVVWPAAIRPHVCILLSYHMALNGKLENSTSSPGVTGGSGAQYKTYAQIMQGFNRWKKPAGARFVR